MIGLKRGIVELVEHQNDWSIEAKNTITELKSILGNICVDIQHIGSTAIPIIHAKPIIDIAVGVYDLRNIISIIDRLNQNDYIFRGEDVPGQLLFIKGDLENDTRTHHIHIVRWNGTEWNNYINFRDYLNAFPEKAKLYDECKQKAASQFPKDRKHYTEEKQHLISCFLKEANVWKIEH